MVRQVCFEFVQHKRHPQITEITQIKSQAVKFSWWAFAISLSARRQTDYDWCALRRSALPGR